MAIRKGFSFRDQKLVDWIDLHGGSKYLAGLVQEDMESGSCDYITKREVIKLIEDRVGSIDFKKENRVIDENIKNGMLGLMKF